MVLILSSDTPSVILQVFIYLSELHQKKLSAGTLGSRPEAGEQLCWVCEGRCDICFTDADESAVLRCLRA